MAVPKYDHFFLPLLRLAGDGAEHTLAEAYRRLAETEGLTAKELEEMLPSGRQTRYENRVSWAITYLKKAGLPDPIEQSAL